ncbi:30S ribosomal protein S17 [candidate division TA06 bacterium DG_78]|uniref:Small ribosomal subunit protein uS17 n=1 Tax=candidate division TA06 bacterium DG_78 TaxID=1703772 RepID=A0A0S7YDU9_UNCT6|nr:MAG: 30S ribosomal protein S17 [candidate division TA06 bacterium DG_78]
MRKRKVGVVIGDKPQKTVIVQIMNYVKHPLYKKYIRRFTKIYAHDEKNECKVGEKVVIEETRPLSKLKRWRVIRRVG